jgi:hypothetical protein
MQRRFLFGAAMCAILLAAATTRSDVAATTDVAVDDTSPIPEPISGTPATPSTTDSPPGKDPFAPYDVGPTESIWPYESLTPSEQAVVDRGRDSKAWNGIHDAYAAAVKERSRLARAQAAQRLLGLDASLESTGVVP